MKKILFITMCLFAIIMVMSCATSPEKKFDGRIPQEVRDAVNKAQKDTIIGIGTANMATIGQARTISGTRARVEISQILDTFVQNMVNDHFAASEVDHSAVISYQREITVQLSRSRFSGAVLVDEIRDVNGNHWTILSLSKTEAVKEINQAIAAAKLAVPAASSHQAIEDMSDYFERFYENNEVGFRERD